MHISRATRWDTVSMNTRKTRRENEIQVYEYRQHTTWENEMSKRRSNMSDAKHSVVRIIVMITSSDFLEDFVYTIFRVQTRIVCCFEQPSKHIDAFLRFGLLHLKRGRNPFLCEVKATLLQCELQHLQSFHKDGANTISLLSVGLSAWREYTLWRNGRCLNRKVIKSDAENRWGW